MKKFVIIIFTLLGLLLSKSLFITNNITVSFNQKSNQPIQYQVFWTDSNNEKFSEHAQKKYTTTENQKHVSIRISNQKMKNFRLDTGIKPGIVEISDLKINGKSLDLNNFSKSKDIESLVVENNKMIIKSNKHDPYLTYKENVNINAVKSVNYPILIMLLCFWLAVSYGVVSFVSNKNNKIDAIFVLLFGILICIPMLHISNAKKSETENRMLATKPKLIVNNDINNKYGTQFNDWFNDRFLGRDLFTDIHNNIKLITNKKKYCNDMYCLINNDFIRKKELAYVPDTDELEQDKEALLKLSDFCKKEKIVCYFAALPEREPFLPDAKLLPQPYLTHTGMLADATQGTKTIFMDLTQILLEADKIEPVFYKTDHHWTDWGAWNAYKAITSRLKHDKNIILKTEESGYKITYNHLIRAEYDREYTKGNLCNHLKLSRSCPLKQKYKYYDLPSHIKRQNRTQDGFAEFTNTRAKYDKIIIIGTSMTESISPFFAQSFKHVYKFRANFNGKHDLNISRWLSDIKTIKPQVLIFLVQSDFLKRLKDMWKE